MDKLEFSKKLEDRTADFSDNVNKLCIKLPKSVVNNEIMRQLIRSAGSIGANYIEANESLSRKDFFHRIRISRKESKESRFWLRRLIRLNPDFEKDFNLLIKESSEFVLIFSKVVSKA